MITAQRGDHQVTRNSSHFKNINLESRPAENNHKIGTESVHVSAPM